MLKIAQKIKNGECPVLCFFGDSITDGQFEFANGHLFATKNGCSGTY